MTKILKRAVPVVEILGLVAAVLFVVALVVRDPSPATSVTPPAGGGAVVVNGQAIYLARCASCHGSDGGGRLGPQLTGRVVTRFPDAADEIDVVTNGRGSMPAFGGSLTPEEIAAVVEFTRTDLG